MSEALKKAQEALQLMYGCKMTLRDRAVVDAALAAIDAEAAERASPWEGSYIVKHTITNGVPSVEVVK